MNFTELKELAKKLGGIVVMNGNVPEFVVLSYLNYRKLDGLNEETNRMNKTNPEEDVIEKLNREILALKEEIRQKEESELLQSNEAAAEESKSESEGEDSLL